MSRPDHIRDRRQIARAFIKQREAHVHMIEEHVRRSRKSAIDDAIEQPDLIATDIRLDPASKAKGFAKNGRLCHLPFRPQNAAITLPPLAIAHESCRDGADTTVQRMADGLLGEIMVGVGRRLLRAQDMIEAASQHEP